MAKPKPKYEVFDRKPKKEKYALFIRIDRDLGEKLAEKAQADTRTITGTVEVILREYFKGAA